MDLTLTCTIELNDAVDTDVTVSSLWTKDGSPLMLDDHITVNGAESITPLSYRTRIMFYPLLNDSGLYTCAVEVSSPSYSVTGTSATGSQHVTSEESSNLLV